jgi:hypothetical protein
LKRHAVTPSLGILHLERGLPPGTPRPNPFPGSVWNPDTHGFPVMPETVEGAWVDNIIRGDPSLGAAFVVAARRLADRGAIVISSTCHFAARHHDAVSASLDVPVGLSSLILLPALLRQLPQATRSLPC